MCGNLDYAELLFEVMLWSQTLHPWQTLHHSLTLAGLGLHHSPMAQQVTTGTFCLKWHVANMNKWPRQQCDVTTMDAGQEKDWRVSRKVWVNMQKLVLWSLQALPPCSCYCKDLVMTVNMWSMSNVHQTLLSWKMSLIICLHNDLHHYSFLHLHMNKKLTNNCC